MLSVHPHATQAIASTTGTSVSTAASSPMGGAMSKVLGTRSANRQRKDQELGQPATRADVDLMAVKRRQSSEIEPAAGRRRLHISAQLVGDRLGKPAGRGRLAVNYEGMTRRPGEFAEPAEERAEEWKEHACGGEGESQG